MLEAHFIMEGKFFVRKGVSRHGVCDTGMSVWELLPFAGLLGRF